MRTVTALQTCGKGRVAVFLDGERAFILYQKELKALDLREGMTLSEDLCAHITQEILLGRAKLRCMHLLESMDRTEKQLRTRLTDGGYPEEVADAAIAYVKDLRCVDDVRYARTYIESCSRTRSMRQITAELTRRGIAQSDLQEALAQAEIQPEEEAVAALARKRKMNLVDPTPEEQKKQYAFFLRKGFSYAAVRSVLTNRVDS